MRLLCSNIKKGFRFGSIYLQLHAVVGTTWSSTRAVCLHKEFDNLPDFDPADFSRWGAFHALSCLLGVFVFAVKGTSVILAALTTFSFIFLFKAQYDKLVVNGPLGGLANQITLVRLILVLVSLISLPALTLESASFLFLTIVLLDVLDGHIARRLESNSLFGMHFDMEVDASFVLLAGCYFYTTNSLGLILLLPGALRYFYCITKFLFPKRHYVEQKNRLVSYAAGVNFTLLTIATLVSGTMQNTILLLSCFIVCLSFSLSFAEYFCSDKTH